MEKLLITPKEAGALLSIREVTVRELCDNDPTFPSTRNGAERKISVQGLQEWVAEKCRKKEAIR